jgi:uncharacterized delta-60 repeat protein
MNKKISLVAILFYMNFATFLDAESTPTVSRAFGQRFVQEVAPSQAVGSVGTFDQSFGEDGVLDLSPQGSGRKINAIAVDTDGSIFAALSIYQDFTYLVKYTSTGVVDTDFGDNGVVVLDDDELNYDYTSRAHGLIIDEYHRVLISGCNQAEGEQGWCKRVSRDGQWFETLANDSPWVFIGALGLQSTGKIIAVGQDDNRNTQIARFDDSGSVDTTFGNNGYVVFNGSSLPVSLTVPYSFVITDDNKIYISIVVGLAFRVYRFTAAGALDTSWGLSSSGYVTVPFLAGTTVDPTYGSSTQTRMSMDAEGNFILAAQVANDIKITALNSVGQALGSFTNFTLSASGETYSIESLFTMQGSQNKILFVGSNNTNVQSILYCLNADGSLDTNFNATDGYQNYIVDNPYSVSAATDIALAPDGRIYASSHEDDGNGIYYPYLSRLHNYQNVSAVLQFPPLVEQGTLNERFGVSDASTSDGVVRTFTGKYGQHLQQKSRAIIETVSGSFIIAQDGKLDNDAISNMMLVRLDSTGVITDRLELEKLYDDGEYITSLLEDEEGNIVVVGYGASEGDYFGIVRKYAGDFSSGVALWEYEFESESSGNKFFGVAIQSNGRILAYGQVENGYGAIVGLTPQGDLDTSFGYNGSGMILSTNYGLDDMTSLYTCAVDKQDNITIGYKNRTFFSVDVALIAPDGSRLITEFNEDGVIAGIYQGVFGEDGITSDNNVRVVLDNEGELLVVIAVAGSYKIKELFAVYGENALTEITTINLGTQLILNQVTVLNDNSIIITGADNITDDAMVIVRLNDDLSLDPNFNAQGYMPGVLLLQVGNLIENYYNREATGLVVQAATGDMVVCGYEQISENKSIPMTLYVYGKPGTTQVKQSPIFGEEIAGSLDTTFVIQGQASSDGAIDLSEIDASLVGQTKAIYIYPSGNDYQGYMIIGIDTGTDTKIIRLRQSDNNLDTTFGDNNSGILTFEGLTGLTSISINVQNKLIITGVQNSQAWAKRLWQDGEFEVDFDIPSTMINIRGCCEQKSGRLMLFGTDFSDAATHGVIIAFQDRLIEEYTTLQKDETFNPLAYQSNSSGSYFVGSTGLYNLAIKSDDTLLTAFSQSTVKVVNITANGSGLVESFATNGVLDTNITPHNPESIRLDIDRNEKIVIASSVGGNTVSVVRYLSAGGEIDSNFNSQAVYTFPTSGSGRLGTAGVALRSLILSAEKSPETESKIILQGHNSAGTNGRMFAARLDVDGTLDQDWNNDPYAPDIAGVLTYSVSGNSEDVSTSLFDASVYINGDIYVAIAGDENTAMLARVNGTNYVGLVAQEPYEYPAGIIDTTLDTQYSSGAYDLRHDALELLNYQPRKLYIYPSGEMLIGYSNGFSHVKLVKYKADRSIDTSFGDEGIVTTSSGQILNDMIVATGENDDNSIYITGQNSDGRVFAAHFSADGEELPFGIYDESEESWYLYIIFQYMPNGFAIRRSLNSRTLVCGAIADNYPCIVAFDNYAYDNDSYFGNVFPGLYIPNFDYYEGYGFGNAIVDMELDSSDRIYTVFNNNDNAIVIQRVLPNGTGVDDENFDTPFIYGLEGQNLSTTQIKIVLDEPNSHLFVAAQDGQAADNYIVLYCYDTENGDELAYMEITIDDVQLELSDLVLDQQGNLYVLGYDSIASYSILARLVLTEEYGGVFNFDLDTTYAQDSSIPGIAIIQAGSMDVVTSGYLHPDRRFYYIGYEQSEGDIPLIARNFGDDYILAVDESIGIALPGENDETLPSAGTPDGGVNFADLSGWDSLSGWVARGVCIDTDGTTYVAFSNGIDVVIGALNTDMVPVTSFGPNSNGLTSGLTMPTVNSMILDWQNKIVVAGMNGSNQIVLRYNADGSLVEDDSSGAVEFESNIGLVEANRIVQQKSGRYLLVGAASAGGEDYEGMILAYRNDGSQVDATYGDAGYDGYYLIQASVGIDDIVLNQDDAAYVVYRDTTVKVEKVIAQGARLDTNFNDGQPLDTGIIATAAARIGINSQGNILVAASSGTSIKTVLYDGSTGDIIIPEEEIEAAVQDLSSVNSYSPILTDITGSDTTFVMVAYETTNNFEENSNQMLFIRMTEEGLLDTSFGVSGIIGNDPQGATEMYAMLVQADGKIAAVGKNSSPDPIYMRAYGTAYQGEVEQFGEQEPAGLLDTTLWPSTGALNLENLISNDDLDLEGYSPKRMYEDGYGKILFAFDNGTSTILVRLNKDLTLDDNFNEYDTPGYIVIYNNTDVSALSVDAQGMIYVAGGESVYAWIKMYDEDGNTQSSFQAGVFPDAGFSDMVIQTLQRIVIAGQDGSGYSVTSVLYGYNSLTGQLDPEFGNVSAGIYDAEITSPIVDIAADDLDRLYIVAVVSGTSYLRRINNTGSLVDTDFGSPVGINNVTGEDEVRVVIDRNNYKAFVVATTSAGYEVKSYNLSNGAVINSGSFAINNEETPHLASAFLRGDGKLTIVGYLESGSVVVGQFENDLTVDELFNPDSEGQGILITSVGSLVRVFDATIHADNRTIFIGDDNSETPTAFMGRVFGNDYVGAMSLSPALGDDAELDVTFNLGDGYVYLNSLLELALDEYMPKAVLPLQNGDQYIALTDGSNSKLIKITNSAISTPILDVDYQTDGIADATAPEGVSGMFKDALENIILVGTDDADEGWIKRYTSTGQEDDSFGNESLIEELSGMATMGLEQTMARYVIAGNNSIHGVLRGYEPDGSVDTLFGEDGIFDSGVSSTIYSVVADQFDRLIFVQKNGTSVNLTRLTSNGEFDITFGDVDEEELYHTGTITDALTNVTGDESSIHVTLDYDGRIIIAAIDSTGTALKFAAFDNGVDLSDNGQPIEGFANDYDHNTDLVNGTMTSLVATLDSYVLAAGYQQSGEMWVTRINASGWIDSSFDEVGDNVFTYGFADEVDSRFNTAIAIFYDGRISSVGYEVMQGEEGYALTNVPFVARLYNHPYYEEIEDSLTAQPIGSNDYTFGLTEDAITTFYASPNASSDEVQKARAIAMQGVNRFILGFDGKEDEGSYSRIHLNRFNMDGILDQRFNVTGQDTLEEIYESEYLNDLLVYQTPDSVNKALIAGYITSNVLSTTSSLLMMYNLDDFELASDFGGYDLDPQGIAFGHIQEFNVVGRQTSSRIIASGMDYDSNGVVLGYTVNGKLDKSFGTEGFYFSGSEDGLYTHAIDTLDRIVFAYFDYEEDEVVLSRLRPDGSELDQDFGYNGAVVTNIENSSSDQVRVAVNDEGEIILVAMNDSGDFLTVQKYNSSGVLEESIRIGIGESYDLHFDLGGLSLTKLLIDNNNKVYILGASHHGEGSALFVMRLLSDLSDYDTSFNDTGYVIYENGSNQNPLDALIHLDGRVVAVGSQAGEILS